MTNASVPPMKRVLVIATDFPPQGGAGAMRVTKFVKYLPQFGWQPLVVCVDSNWNRDESLLADLPPGLLVRRVPWPSLIRRIWRPGLPPSSIPVNRTDKQSPAQILRRAGTQLAWRLLVPDVYRLWIGAAERACVQLLREQPCDVVFTTSPPSSVHLVAQRLHARFRLPWVADFRDVWTANNQALRQLGKLNYARQLHKERTVLQECDRAVMVTSPLADYARETFRIPAAKFATITNGFDPSDFAGPTPPLDRSHFVIAHIGTIIGSAQAQNDFPDGLRLALAQSETFRRMVRVRFVGQLNPEFRARFAGLDQNVEVAGFMPHAAAVDLMRRAHVLLLVMPDGGQLTSPNKFFEHLAARRPMLAIVRQGFISDIITREEIGLAAPPDDAPAIARALLSLFDSVRAEPNGNVASPSLLARFDRRELTKELITVLSTARRAG